MILTGKAKEDFIKWCKTQNSLKIGLQMPNTIGGVVLDLSSNIELMPENFKNTLIIEWFDSVGIYIELKRFCHGLKFRFWNYVISNPNGAHLNNFLEVEIENDSRQEVTLQAIKKANEIYNEKK